MNSRALPSSSSQAFLQYIFLAIHSRDFSRNFRIHRLITRNLPDLFSMIRSLRTLSSENNHENRILKKREKKEEKERSVTRNFEPSEKTTPVSCDIREKMVGETADGTTFPPFAISERANKNVIHICPRLQLA